MVAPSLRALGAVLAASTGTPTFSAPAGAVATDLIICAWFQDDGRTSVSAVLPAGFVQAVGSPQRNDALAGSPSHSLNVYVGTFAAVGPGPYVFTVVAGIGTPTPFCEGRSAAIRDAGTIWEGIPSGNTSGNSNVSTAPLVSSTSARNDCYAFYIATNWAGGAWTPPVGYTEQWDANDRIITFADLNMPVAAVTSPQATNVSSNRMNAWVGIIPPVSSAEANPIVVVSGQPRQRLRVPAVISVGIGAPPAPPTPADVEWCAGTPFTSWAADTPITDWAADTPVTGWMAAAPIDEECC